MIDIAMIGATVFRRYTKKKDAEVFVTSLAEIEQILREKTYKPDDEEREILEKLLTEYHDFRYVFSKKASDTLPPRSHCDHKIELEGNIPPTEAIGHGPLYKQSAEGLEADGLLAGALTERIRRNE
jgi:hypothetical protein